MTGDVQIPAKVDRRRPRFAGRPRAPGPARIRTIPSGPGRTDIQISTFGPPPRQRTTGELSPAPISTTTTPPGEAPNGLRGSKRVTSAAMIGAVVTSAVVTSGWASGGSVVSRGTARRRLTRGLPVRSMSDRGAGKTTRTDHGRRATVNGPDQRHPGSDKPPSGDL